MELNGDLHAPAALHPKKELPVSIGQQGPRAVLYTVEKR
jgi:hypothetical protein